MNRRIIPALTALLALLCACVPTPEQEFVVNKADEQLEAIIEDMPTESYESTQQTLREAIGAPETVEEAFTVQVYGGTLDVSVEAEVTVPEVSAVPVFSAAIGWEAMKDRAEIVHSLLGDEVWRVSNARAAVISCEQEIARYNAYLADLNEGKQHTDLSLEQEREWVEQNLSATWNNLNVYDENADEPVLWDGSFEPYESDRGVVYLYSEPYLLRFLEPNGVYQDVWFDDLSKEPRTAVSLGIKPGEEHGRAVETAKMFFAAFSDTPIEPFAVDAGGDGTVIVFASVHADIPYLPLKYDNGDDIGYAAANGDVYERKYKQEELTVCVQDGAAAAMRWESPLYITDTENGNVALKPFEEILQLFRTHIRATYYLHEDENTGEPGRATIHITAIRFSYARVEKKNGTGYYLLPVWDFCGYAEWQGDANDAETKRQLGWNSSFITINAIDGSIIDRNKGY